MPKPKYPRLRKIFRRRGQVRKLQAHTLVQAADETAKMEIPDHEKAFWCGVNCAANDLWLLTTDNDPVHLPGLWAKLERMQG